MLADFFIMNSIDLGVIIVKTKVKFTAIVCAFVTAQFEV